MTLRRQGDYDIQKRAQGGSDFDSDRLIALCRPGHAQADAAFAQGRLVITPWGAGRFHCAGIHGSDKWASRAEKTGPRQPHPHGSVDTPSARSESWWAD